MVRRSQGRVVALSSNTTNVLGPTNGAYTASKVALESVVVTLAKEEASYGVRINALAPSLVESPLADYVLKLKGVRDRKDYISSLPWGRMISRESIADVATSIVLDDSWDYVTGQVIRFASGAH